MFIYLLFELSEKLKQIVWIFKRKKVKSRKCEISNNFSLFVCTFMQFVWQHLHLPEPCMPIDSWCSPVFSFWELKIENKRTFFIFLPGKWMVFCLTGTDYFQFFFFVLFVLVLRNLFCGLLRHWVLKQSNLEVLKLLFYRTLYFEMINCLTNNSVIV